MVFHERIFCGQVTEADVGRPLLLAGWVDAFRDHGGLLFIHLRDRSGILQVVISPEVAPPEVCALAATLRAEFCIAVRGALVRRQAGTENPNIETGTLELMVSSLTVLAESDALPFAISEKAMVAGAAAAADAVAEDTRLQYRYLDLRRPSMRDHLIARHRIFQCVRRFLDDKGFLEIETPVLTASTPEGARDYLVPSRVHPKNFYALPQSPQLFKQLLMVGGLERYFQLVRCFRDEDLRPNRQPEIHPARSRGLVHRRGVSLRADRGVDRPALRCRRHHSAAALPAHDLCRGNGLDRLGQARSALRPAVCRCDRCLHADALRHLPPDPSARRLHQGPQPQRAVGAAQQKRAAE
jgi:hypothetical protein